MVNAKMIVGITVAALVILVLLAVAPMIGSTVDDVSNIQDNVQATGTLTFTGASAVNNIVNISTETYTFTNGTGGAFNVDVGSDAGNATYSTSQLVAEINANSTLVTAVDNADDSLTTTSVLTGTAGNAYGTTDNVTNAAWGAITLTGGIDGSDWNSNVNSDLNSPAQSWITFVGLIVLAFLAVIIGLVIRAFRGMGE